MIFEKKKIQIETLSEYLSSIRLNLNLSLEEVAKRTGITGKFIIALENGQFKLLPADVYVFGFLKQLAGLYATDAEILIQQYKKERGIQKKLVPNSGERGGVWLKKYFGMLVVTPKILSLALGTIFVFATLSYIIWQVWSINRTPTLEIYQPLDNQIIQSASTEIRGKTDPGMTVSVNGQIIFVDSQGNFQTQLGLSPGPKQLVVTAKNRFDKSFSQTLNITQAATSTSPASSQLQLKVDFSSPVTLGFTIDDQAPQSLDFNKGDSKTFIGQRQILLSTSDAGATKITLNGQILGFMGRPKEQLVNIPFFAQPINPSQLPGN